jgi:hypothetical protein
MPNIKPELYLIEFFTSLARQDLILDYDLRSPKDKEFHIIVKMYQYIRRPDENQRTHQKIQQRMGEVGHKLGVNININFL